MIAKYIVTLTTSEREELHQIVNKGKNAPKIKRANILLAADEAEGGKKMTDEVIGKAFSVSIRTVERLRKRFVEEGFAIALKGKNVGTPIPRKIDGDIEAKIIALTRMSETDGSVKWSYQSIANQMVEKGYIESISHESVRKVLKKMRSNHTSKYVG